MKTQSQRRLVSPSTRPQYNFPCRPRRTLIPTAQILHRRNPPRSHQSLEAPPRRERYPPRLTNHKWRHRLHACPALTVRRRRSSNLHRWESRATSTSSKTALMRQEWSGKRTRSGTRNGTWRRMKSPPGTLWTEGSPRPTLSSSRTSKNCTPGRQASRATR